MVRIELKEIVSNYDNKRKALNAVERGNKKTNPQYPYYGANGIVDFIDEYIFDEELLCIAEDGGNWGYKQSCSYIANGKYWVNNHVHVLKPKKNVEIKYLMYYLNYTDLTSYITGTTRGKLTRTALDKIQINLPELEIQKEIVIILDKIVTMIDKKKKQINLLEELVKSRFIEMFGDPIKNDKGWEESYLKNLSVIIMGQSPPSNSYNNIGKGLPFYQGNIDFGDKYPKLNKFCSEPLKIAKKKSILMSVRAPVGEINITNWDCCIGRGLCSLELAESLNIEYLYNYLKNIIVTVKSKSRGSTFKSINKLEIENIRVLLPPLSLQNEFSQFVEKTDKLKFEAEKSLKEMENLYESLMQKFFKQN